MIKSIFYKETIKCRRIVATLALVSVTFVVYTFLNNAYELRNTGAVGVFSSVSEQSGSVIPNFIKWFLVLIPICISAMQYVCEVLNKRLKLTLHLPCSETNIISAMQLFGLSSSVLVYAIIIVPIYLGMLIYYPHEILVLAYLHCCLICWVGSLVIFSLCGLSLSLSGLARWYAYLFG